VRPFQIGSPMVRIEWIWEMHGGKNVKQIITNELRETPTRFAPDFTHKYRDNASNQKI